MVTDFRLNPVQQAFLDNPGRFTFIPPRHSYGRTAAAIACIEAEAVDDNEAQLAVEDLRTTGLALMRDGRRVEPPKRKPPRVVFDELPRSEENGIGSATGQGEKLAR